MQLPVANGCEINKNHYITTSGHQGPYGSLFVPEIQGGRTMNVHNNAVNERRSNSRIVTREEEAKIVTLLRDAEHSQSRGYNSDVADLIEILIDTGMRMLETLQLRYKDINFMSNLITVQTTKGDRNRRIPMTKRVAAILKRRLKIDPLKPFNITEFQVSRAWNCVKEQIGLKGDKDFVLYALRKTCGYRLFNSGVELEIVQDWLGYRTIQPRRLAPLPPLKLVHAAELLDKWCSNHPSE
jgi:integrase